MRNEGPKCKNRKRLQKLGCQTWHYLKAKICHFWSKEETKNVKRKEEEEEEKRREEEEKRRRRAKKVWILYGMYKTLYRYMFGP